MDKQYPDDQYKKDKRVVNFPEEAVPFQIDVASTEKLNRGWQLHTSPEKCKVIVETNSLCAIMIMLYCRLQRKMYHSGIKI